MKNPSPSADSIPTIHPGALCPDSTPTDDAYLFSYFADPDGKDGLRLAWSEDGLQWMALNSNRGLFAPTIGDEIFRDPCIFRDPDDTYHLLWTTGWHRRGIGYSSSRDLINWTPQREIEVMGDAPGVLNCWAPEAVYDAKRGEVVIFWSSTVEGRFSETQGKKDRSNNRIYACTTKDFGTFSPPSLFFDPGYMVIDATILPFGGRYVMVFKDETLEPVAKKNLRVAWSDDAHGPYGEISPPFTPPIWVEGPSVLPTENGHIIYFDAYKTQPPAYGAMKTHDFKTFTDISADISFPSGAKHGHVFKVPRPLLDDLRARYECGEA